jgi:sigma54-dependent transcription regulator
VAARTIHLRGERRDRPFMAVSCAALTETLLESELFGHEKGAFTGANERRRGRIELADGGTFFLDEVGELKPELQAKLLRVIQERTFERVGGTRSISVDVRWIAATNRDLAAMMKEGRFREDLYHRLAVFPIRLPPLRDRLEDLPPIARALLVDIGRELQRARLTLSPEAEAKLMTWHTCASSATCSSAPPSSPTGRSSAPSTSGWRRGVRARRPARPPRRDRRRSARSPTSSATPSWPPCGPSAATAARPPSCSASASARSTTS